MQFGPGSGSTTTQAKSPFDVMSALAQKSKIPVADVTAIQNGLGLTPDEMLPYIAGLGAAHQANPSAEPGQLAASVIGASPTQVAAIDKTGKAQESIKGQTGGFTAIFGDLFEVIYPFFMFTLGAVALSGFVIVTLVGISKSGVGKAALSGASAGAGFAALAA